MLVNLHWILNRGAKKLCVCLHCQCGWICNHPGDTLGGVHSISREVYLKTESAPNIGGGAFSEGEKGGRVCRRSFPASPWWMQSSRALLPQCLPSCGRLEPFLKLLLSVFCHNNEKVGSLFHLL